jgi:hypothetical protein
LKNSQLTISVVIVSQDPVLLLPLSSAAFGYLEQLRHAPIPKEMAALAYIDGKCIPQRESKIGKQQNVCFVLATEMRVQRPS